MSSGSGRRGRAVCVVPVDVMVRQLIPSIRQGLKALPDVPSGFFLGQLGVLSDQRDKGVLLAVSKLPESL